MADLSQIRVSGTLYDIKDATARMAIGSPAVAATASAMTDQSRVYVYTGSESGYTNGNWYYYNGSSWVSGGVYNSAAVETDTSLSVSGAPADAKVTGDSIKDIVSVGDSVQSDYTQILVAETTSTVDVVTTEEFTTEISALRSAISGGGLSAEAKQALMNAFNHVVWDDDDPSGQTYITALQTALYPPASLASISAVYTQTGTVYDTDSLDSLKDDLVVTAHYTDSTSEIVTSYALSGTLTVGTSTITVTYGGKSTTFTVTVSTSPYIMDGIVHYWDAIDNTGSGHDSSATVWKDLIGNCDLTMNSGVTSTSWDANALVFAPTSTTTKQGWQNTDGITDSTNMTVEVIMTPASNVGNSMVASFKSYATNQNKRIGMSASDISCLVYSADASGGYLTGLSSLADVRQIVGTYTSQSGSSGCYINGVQKTTRASHSYNGSLTGMVVGSYNDNSASPYPFKGKIHAIRVYNRVLTAEEIQTNYQKAITYYGLE